MIAPPAPRSRRTWDLVLTIVLLVVVTIAAVVLGYAGVFVGFVSDPCDGRCDTGLISAGVLLAVFGPAVLALVAIVVAVVLLVRRRIAFWAPVAALALQVGALFLGYSVAASGVHT